MSAARVPSAPAALALGLILAAAVAALAQEATPPPPAVTPSASGWDYPPCPFAGTPPDHPPGVCHPYPQPRPQPSVQTTAGCPHDCRTEIATGEGIFPPANPFHYETFPGTNFLPTVYTDLFDGLGERMPNTLPSTPTIPYNLHDGDPQVSEINERSPIDDLAAAFAEIADHSAQVVAGEQRRRGGAWTRLDEEEVEVDRRLVREAIRFGLDVIEGEPVPERAYSGFPLLHYEGPAKVKKVEPITAPDGTVIGGNVDVHQIWYGQHIESDTALVDPSAVLDVPWTVTYTVDVLSRGHDDFSPFVTYTDNPAASPWIDEATSAPCPYAEGDPERAERCKQAPPMPGAGMDQTFFNMEDGTRTVFRIKMTPGKYLNLIYTWGWRMHPPRIQVMEKATKTINYGAHPSDVCPREYQGCSLPQLEQAVFCNPDDPATPRLMPATAGNTCSIPDLPACTSVRCAPGEPRFDEDGEPTQCERNKLYAIGRIGDLSPAKRMWRALGRARDAAAAGDFGRVGRIVEEEAVPAFRDWQDRTRLPEGVEVDPGSDLTILYVNNTIYGELTRGGWVRWPEWVERPATLKVTAYNGDRYVHSYVIADFGGNRGWENQFKSSTKVAGSGCWFTFGRNYWWLPAGGPNGFLCVPPAEGEGAYGKAGVHRFEVTFNYDPSRRLRFYQFDPFHHDVSIYSLH